MTSLLACRSSSGIGTYPFMNVAMLRAARYLWSEAVSGFGAQDPKSLALRTHCHTRLEPD